MPDFPNRGAASHSLATRRGLFAAAGALAASLAAKFLRPGAAQAGHDGTNVFHLGATNVYDVARVQRNVPPLSFAVLKVVNTHNGPGRAIWAESSGTNTEQGGVGLLGWGGTIGVFGPAGAVGGYGVEGRGGHGAAADSYGGAGVRGSGGEGHHTQSHCGAGVEGFGGRNYSSLFPEGRPGAGVVGHAGGFSGSQADGVVGTTDSTSGAGVVGENRGTNPGVLGIAHPNPSAVNIVGAKAGVYGFSNSGIGTRGVSGSSYGVDGQSSASHGVGGRALGTGAGVYGLGAAAGYAGRFDGRVLVQGAFTVLGGPKSAAVPHPDGTHRRLYCLESPQAWFEDFGGARLVGARRVSRSIPTSPPSSGATDTTCSSPRKATVEGCS